MHGRHFDHNDVLLLIVISEREMSEMGKVFFSVFDIFFKPFKLKINNRQFLKERGYLQFWEGILDLLGGKETLSCWVDFCSSRDPLSAKIRTFPTSCFTAGPDICMPSST